MKSDDVLDQTRLGWVLKKLPRWDVRVDAGMWVAVSPTYSLDGLVIHGRTAEELVHRVQVQVCVEALALDRAGRRPPGGVLCGVDFTGLIAVTEPAVLQNVVNGAIRDLVDLPSPSRGGIVLPGMPSPLPTWGDDPPPSVLGPAQAAEVLRLVGSNPTTDANPPKPKPAIPQGRAFGFEGDPCPECGTMTMVRNGSCLKCTSCGASTGCS